MKTDTDSGSGISSLCAALLYCDSRAYGVSPYSVFEADRLCFTNDLVAVDTLCESDLLAFFDRGDTVFGKNTHDLVNTSFIAFK